MRSVAIVILLVAGCEARPDPPPARPSAIAPEPAPAPLVTFVARALDERCLMAKNAAGCMRERVETGRVTLVDEATREHVVVVATAGAALQDVLRGAAHERVELVGRIREDGGARVFVLERSAVPGAE